MGRIRTKGIKQSAKLLREAYPDSFAKSFDENKNALEEMKLFESKRMRNKVAGYITRLAVRRRATRP